VRFFAREKTRLHCKLVRTECLPRPPSQGAMWQNNHENNKDIVSLSIRNNTRRGVLFQNNH